MTTDTRNKILGYIKMHGKARPHDLTSFLGIGLTAVHRQLKRLVSMGELIKTGKSPLVFYELADGGQRILDLISDNKQGFRDLGAGKIGLFGSFVRGEQREDSDLDLLVEFLPGQKSYRNLLGVASLAEKLTGHEVDILTHQSVSPYIAPHIAKEIKYVQTA